MNHRHDQASETLIYATYYAPRGRRRLFRLGSDLSQRYLKPDDLLIGVLGAEGAGKSTLIMGLFPGLQLTNDDDGVNVTPAPLYDFSPDDHFSAHTFHIDVRFERAFKQTHEIVEAINRAITHRRRVIVEHFDLIYDALGYNAQVLFGVGEEVIVARPSVFGPHPPTIKAIVDKTIKFRLMAHTAEDITSLILYRDYGYRRPMLHSDVKHGFVIKFPEKPAIDIAELEAKVKAVIDADDPVQGAGEDRLAIGAETMYCTGTRTHVKSTGHIERFRLVKNYQYDPIEDEYLLVGMVGDREVAGFEDMAGDLDGGDITAPFGPSED
ncbi:MAG: alanine-tRNA synthetase second additional domain-containing protein [Chitinivibrionales bacterium]|nr:alanine-tRNA synthetase second additional domain-containing protein [Chitinivibrionales bacterium]